MFTGIIEEVGRIRSAIPWGGGRRLTVEATFAPDLRIDQSVAVNGACQTVVGTTATTFEVVAIEETLRKTTLGQLTPGDHVNLERAMQPHDRLDGHIVQGHVDATGIVVAVVAEQTSHRYTIRFDPSFAAYVIPVGAIALDGISLTVARLEDNTLSVAIIPHTSAHTTIASWQVGTAVNMEFDMLGKYVVRWLNLQRADASPAGLSEAWLREKGFG